MLVPRGYSRVLLYSVTCIMYTLLHFNMQLLSLTQDHLPTKTNFWISSLGVQRTHVYTGKHITYVAWEHCIIVWDSMSVYLNFDGM